MEPKQAIQGGSVDVIPAKKRNVTECVNTDVNRDQILGALPGLNRSELEAIQAVVVQLLGGRVSNVSNGATIAPQTVFDALVAAISRPMPYSQLPPVLAKQYERHFPSLIIFFDKHFKGWDSNKITQTGFLRMIFSLMVSDLKSKNVIPSVQNLIYNLPRIYQIVDNAFPSYLEAGMGHMVLNVFKKRSV